jgi:hypothetical protein
MVCPRLRVNGQWSRCVVLKRVRHTKFQRKATTASQSYLFYLSIGFSSSFPLKRACRGQFHSRVSEAIQPLPVPGRHPTPNRRRTGRLQQFYRSQSWKRPVPDSFESRGLLIILNPRHLPLPKSNDRMAHFTSRRWETVLDQSRAERVAPSGKCCLSALTGLLTMSFETRGWSQAHWGPRSRRLVL